MNQIVPASITLSTNLDQKNGSVVSAIRVSHY